MEDYGDGDSLTVPLCLSVRVPSFSYNINVWFLNLEALWDGEDLCDRHWYLAVIRALPSRLTFQWLGYFPRRRTGMQPSSPLSWQPLGGLARNVSPRWTLCRRMVAVSWSPSSAGRP